MSSVAGNYCFFFYYLIFLSGFLGLIGRSGDANEAAALKATLASPDLTREQLDTLMKQFVDTAKVTVEAFIMHPRRGPKGRGVAPIGATRGVH